MIAGADWFQGSWLVVMDGDDGRETVRKAVDFSDFLKWPDLALLVIDVPIGLPDRGPRSCDTQARKIVKPRGSSVFPAPIRPALNARTHEEACRIWESTEGKGCSVQAFGIFPIVAGVDRQMTPQLQARIREGHPELSFACMNGGSGLKHSKHTPEGQQMRIKLLEPDFPTLRVYIAALKSRRAVVDMLDAFAMLWTARRVRAGLAAAVPDKPEYDTHGLRMEMVV